MMYRTPEDMELFPFSSPVLTDLITGQTVEIVSPSCFVLETVLVNTAYYRVEDREFRFRLPDARIAGLKIEK